MKEIDFDINLEEIEDKIFDNIDYWVPRPHMFHTFGAAIYLDKPDSYKANIKKCNDKLLEEFGELYNKLGDYFGAELNPNIAYPGFHIFGHEANGATASAHFDLPYERLPFADGNFSDPESFTIPIKSPSCGAGLNLWPNIRHSSYKDNEISLHNIGKPDYCEYKYGKMYIHDGYTLHQIARGPKNDGMLRRYEFRLTLQGHVITMNGKRYMYF